MAEDRCICCGEVIPEGRMVCPYCLVSQKTEKCNWCEPGHETCGTCKRYFDYFGDGTEECSAMFDDEQCVGYAPIDYCPKCGRKLVSEDVAD